MDPICAAWRTRALIECLSPSRLWGEGGKKIATHGFFIPLLTPRRAPVTVWASRRLNTQTTREPYTMEFLTQNWPLILLAIALLIVLIVLLVFFSFLRLYIQAWLAGAQIGIIDLV